MSYIAGNIRILRTQEKLSQEQFAENMKVPRSRISAYEEGRAEPGINFLICLSDYFRVSIDVLVRVDLNKTDINSLMKIGNNRMLLPIVVNDKGKDKIEVVSAKASAGYLNGYADPDFIEGLPMMNLPFTVTGKNRAFPIKGNSMPPANTGDYVVGKYVESFSDIKDGDTYIVITRNDGIVYKRLYTKQYKNSGHILFESDNKEYDSYKVNTKDVLEIWEYVCLLRTSDKKTEDLNIDSMINFLRSIKVEVKK